MNSTDKEFFKFIEDNLMADPSRLRLKYTGRQLEFNLEEAILQIESRKKYREKLKNFISVPGIIFPDSLAGEQSSHEGVAKYHAELVKGALTLLDMSAGLGIDTIAFAKVCHKVIAIEINQHKARVLENNLKKLSLNNVLVKEGNSISFLENTKEVFDVIFVDPARRDSNLKRVYGLNDCEPHIPANMILLSKKCRRLMIKASPLLDISQTLRDFPCLSAIRVVGVKGECKEVLIEINFGNNLNVEKDIHENSNVTQDIILEAIDLDIRGIPVYRFTVSADDGNKIDSSVQFAEITDIKNGVFIYEPSAMIMKLMPWNELSAVFKGIKKLDKSSHIFIGENLYNDFPGRITQIDKILTKNDRKTLKGFPANIVSRNYPESADQLRKLFQLKEGKDNFIYATRVASKPVMILSKR